MAGMNVFDALKRGFDRAGFEADKMMRYNRIKSEANRLSDQVKKQTQTLGERALELYNQGALADTQVAELAAQIADLQRRVQAKEQEAAVVQAEAWPELEQEPENSGTATSTTAPGSASEPRCKTCGATMRAGALFCSRCGAAV